ncbi:MAG: hypothetical protein IJT96_05295 [Lachnospiraceae bacterium]|nr:hypothetical protein [Lachnospiraceae bacterium]
MIVTSIVPTGDDSLPVSYRVKSIRAYAKKHGANLYYRIEKQDWTRRLVMMMVG